MKRTILALALVATTFGAFAQTPAATTKPVEKVKAHKKAEVKKAEAPKTEAAKPEATKTAPVAAPKAVAKPAAKQK